MYVSYSGNNKNEFTDVRSLGPFLSKPIKYEKSISDMLNMENKQLSKGPTRCPQTV